jgi:hypothetical protein
MRRFGCAMWRRATPCGAILAFLFATVSFGATTQTWELNNYQDFLRGRLSGLTLTRDGRLKLGPKLDEVFASDQAEIWSLARASDGTLYAGTGNRGRLYKIDASGNATLLWTADQPIIFALTVDPKGVIYAATSPDGKIYRIENGRASEYFAPKERYIWALALSPSGDLFAATGDQGKIYRITAAGRGSVYYETGQSNVTSLAFDAQGRLLAGSEPNGILYQIASEGKAFVLYDANLPEIRSIVAAPDGSIYAAALGGSTAKRVGAATTAAAAAQTSSLPTFSTSVTVTDQQAGITPLPSPSAAKSSSVSSAAATSVTTSTTEYSGVEKSALYKIHPDHTVETLWSSKEENLYDLALDGTSLMLLTDAQGRIYKLDSSRQAALVAQTNEGDSTRLVPSPGGLLAATGNLAKVVRLGSSTAPAGWFESPVHDSSTVARWGRLSWRGDSKGLAFRTRAGNSARPDSTWSDWSQPLTTPDRALISSPNARYIQWRVDFSAPAELDSVTIAYLPQNTPPIVRSILVTSQAQNLAKSTTATTAATSANAAYSITVTDTGDSSTAAGTPSLTLSRATGQQISITWQADDPDGDRLLYSLYFRGDDESQWKLLRGDITENTYQLDGDVFADGRYFFRVTASDRLANPLELAREAELVSAPVVIDNTPPTVTTMGARRNGSSVEIDVDAQDRGSELRRCEYSIDAGPWFPVEAADGVTDSAREQFNIRIQGIPQGEHLVVIRVYDATGNAGLTKVVVR